MSAHKPSGDVLEALAQEHGKPGEPDYHNNLGIAHLARGQLEAAIREHREAVRLKPSEAMFHCNLGIALGQKGEHEEALREFHEALRLNRDDYHSHYSLGNLLSKLGRVEEATAEYQRAIAADSERPEAHFNLAETYFERKQWEQGVAHYEAALAHELEPEVASTAHLRLGAFHTERRAWEKAEKHLLQAVDLGPEDFMTNYCLALVYLNIDWGESGWAARSKALLFAKKAMELDPEDEDAREVARAALAALEKARPPSQAASRQPIASPSRTWWQFWKR